MDPALLQPRFGSKRWIDSEHANKPMETKLQNRAQDCIQLWRKMVQHFSRSLGEGQSDASTHVSLEGPHFDETNSSAPWSRQICISLNLGWLPTPQYRLVFPGIEGCIPMHQVTGEYGVSSWQWVLKTHQHIH